jgi:hypothetical protein
MVKNHSDLWIKLLRESCDDFTLTPALLHSTYLHCDEQAVPAQVSLREL